MLFLINDVRTGSLHLLRIMNDCYEIYYIFYCICVYSLNVFYISYTKRNCYSNINKEKWKDVSFNEQTGKNTDSV